jgi:hypothetical protein
LRPPQGLYPVADGNYHVKGVKVGWLVRIRKLHFLQIPFFFQFTFAKDIFYMAADYTGIPLKKFSHLVLCKPDRLTLKGNLNLGQTILGLVHD